MDIYNNLNRIKAFVPSPVGENNMYYRQLYGVLQSANIEVITSEQSAEKADCAILLIGNEYKNSNRGLTISDEEYWFNKACQINTNNSSYRIFIWQPGFYRNNDSSSKQTAFINSIRNHLIQNMMFCNYLSPVMFVEDIRTVMYEEQKTKFDTKLTDVFFIFNEIDEDHGHAIVELLSDVVKVELLSISLRSETDYSEFIAQQIKKSYLTTIYYNRTANWAVPFTQQVWKKIGGASSDKKILMIGDADYDSNQNIAFDAPNVTSMCTGTELIPLETKVFYDKIHNNK